jgi:hypothetical protein
MNNVPRVFADEHRLTIKPGDWPKPFLSYEIHNHRGQLTGFVGKNVELDDRFFIQLYNPAELNHSWAAVKRPQPVWTGKYKTVVRCLFAASTWLSQQAN